MKNFWLIINVGLVILCAFGGYSLMSPENLRQENPDVILCSILLVVMPLFAIGTVSYSIHTGKCEKLRRPSWNRHAIDWWHDPLQSLFISNWTAAALAIGSAIRLPEVHAAGFWVSAMCFCLAIGLLIGQFLVYRIFRARIVKS
jgi:hypothetical protein